MHWKNQEEIAVTNEERRERKAVRLETEDSCGQLFPLLVQVY